ncbi:hypothetical protein T07_2304 [Trichinella nelsoni]|uniref:Transmembrane protein n=1 Tax=Trichinella nelsoni TaxID=6336 RepID=A0A0V0RH13_9BILA|nr:hypothetical protein T07_2304 [Trichinella nelsoni]
MRIVVKYHQNVADVENFHYKQTVRNEQCHLLISRRCNSISRLHHSVVCYIRSALQFDETSHFRNIEHFRIIAASLSAYLYESCWLSKDQLLGYLWALNSRHSKQLEPAATWHRFGNFNLHVTIFLHLLSACIIWQLGKHIPSLKPTCLHDVWFHTFWLSVIHYVLSLTKLTALDTHWQPHLHEHINGFFKFFVITICLYVKPGCRFAQRVHNEQSTHRTCITHVE